MIPVFLAESEASVLFATTKLSYVPLLDPAAYKPNDTFNVVVPTPTLLTYALKIPVSPGPYSVS